MTTVKLNDKTFSLFISNNTIQQAINDVASRINNDYKEKLPLFMAILNGSFMFAADLLKKININCEITFVKLSSYSGTSSTQQVKQLIGFNEDIKGREVVILEDIIDSGLTMEHLLEKLETFQPAGIRIASLLLKPDAFIKNFPIDYVGLRIPNDFIVGFGLDYNGLGRNLPDIYKIVI